jgi:hypothetical protein
VAQKKRKQAKKRRPRRISQKDDAFSLDNWLHRFQEAVSEATTSICKKREATDTIDIVEVIIETLFFRNCHIYETLVFLLDRSYLIGAELLLRCLFEGSVLVEWCVVDPKVRAQSLHKTILNGKLNLAGKRYLGLSTEQQDMLRNAVLSIDEQNIRGLPNFRQIVESLSTYRKSHIYNFYKYLSKNVHGLGVDPSDFLCTQGERAEVCRVKTPPSPKRLIDCRVWASLVQMNNIKAISSFDKAIKYEKLHELEVIWATLYTLLEAEGKE